MSIGELNKVTPGVAVNLGVFAFSFLCPGFLMWYMYDPELVKSLDFLKLCVLSVAISCPTFVIPYSLTAVIRRVMCIAGVERIELYGDYVDWYLRHGMANALNMYVIIISVFLFDLEGGGIFVAFCAAIGIGVLHEFLLMIFFIKNPEKTAAIQFERPRG